MANSQSSQLERPEDKYYKAIYIGKPDNINLAGINETYLLIPNKEYLLGTCYDYTSIPTPHGNKKVRDKMLLYVYDSQTGKCLGRDYNSRTKEKAAERWQLVEKLS